MINKADDDRGIVVLEKIAKEFFYIPVVFTTHRKNDATLWRKARSKGAVEVLYKDYTVESVLEIAKRYDTLKTTSQTDESEVKPTAGRLYDSLRADNLKQPQRMIRTDHGGFVIKQEIITVYSPKGGVGKTTIACNLAVALAINKEIPLRVCLVDLDVSFGTVATMLQIEPEYDFLDWDQFQPEQFNRKLVDQLVTRHSESGIDVIVSPERVEDSARINEGIDGEHKGKELTEKVINALRPFYDVIVIDIGSDLKVDSAITAIDMSTKVLVVGTSDIPTLKNILSCKETFENIGIDQSKMRMVLNRTIKNHGINMQAIHEVVMYPLIGKSIPEDQTVVILGNQCKLPVIHARKSPFTEALITVVNSIMPVYTKEKQAEGFFARLFSRRRGKVAV